MEYKSEEFVWRHECAESLQDFQWNAYFVFPWDFFNQFQQDLDPKWPGCRDGVMVNFASSKQNKGNW